MLKCGHAPYPWWLKDFCLLVSTEKDEELEVDKESVNTFVSFTAGVPTKALRREHSTRASITFFGWLVGWGCCGW